MSTLPTPAPHAPDPAGSRRASPDRRPAPVRLLSRLLRRGDDRGDVPGWVLVAVMTAGLVTAIWLVADGQLTSVLDRALSSIAGP